jgi:kynurenine formamidase
VTALTGQGGAGVSPDITAAMVQDWEAEHGALRPEEVVVFYSGWDRFYRPNPEGQAYVFNPFMLKQGPGWPSPDAACVTYLADRGIRCIATDGVSIGSSHDGPPAHWAGLSRGLVYVEGLSRLGELPTRGAFFIFLPIKVRNGSGGPGRAIAFVPR